MNRFALLGAAGYIAPRHMKAINETGNELVAAMDVNDSVGVIDSHFPNAQFFTDFELLDAYAKAERWRGEHIDYVSIATPNFLHFAHIQWALRNGSDALCEKPLVLYPEQLDALKAIESETGKRVHTVLQLRLHPAILALRERVARAPSNQKADVDLTYITSRGNWYLKSWKGLAESSGGIAANIGVHFFDMLNYVYGGVQNCTVHLRTPTKAAGYLEFERARVRWFLSLDVQDIPAAERAKGKRTFRSIIADGESLEFSDGFTDLHTRVYEDILNGGGFGVEDNRCAIETVTAIRESKISSFNDLTHPFAMR